MHKTTTSILLVGLLSVGCSISKVRPSMPEQRITLGREAFDRYLAARVNEKKVLAAVAALSETQRRQLQMRSVTTAGATVSVPMQAVRQLVQADAAAAAAADALAAASVAVAAEGSLRVVHPASAVPRLDGRALVDPTDAETVPIVGNRTFLAGDLNVDLTGRTGRVLYRRSEAGLLAPTELQLDAVRGDRTTQPGYFDVMAGIGVLPNAHAERNNDETGLFVVAKGYPCQQWYVQKQIGTGDGSTTAYAAVPEAEWYQRFSLNFGIGTALQSDVIETPALMLGVGFDVAPQMGILIGAAWYEFAEGRGIGDDNCSLFLGVSISLSSLADLISGSKSLAAWPAP